MGLFDKLFGGANSLPSQFTVYEVGTDGCSTYVLKVGQDIDEENAAKLSNISANGIVYAIHSYVNGEKKKRYVNREIYLKMKSAMDSFG